MSAVQHQKDGLGPTTGGFLSKASYGLRRSPSKKHKYGTSDARPPLNTAGLEFPSSQSNATSNRPGFQYRPGFQRAPTTDGQTLRIQVTKGGTRDEKLPRSAVQTHFGRGAGTSPRTDDMLQLMNNVGGAVGAGMTGIPASPQTSSTQNPNWLYQHIHDVANKRISTLDYLSKAHEGRIYWYNTVYFSRQDLSQLRSFTPARLARRARNYMLLGISIPAVLDVHPAPHQSAQSTSVNASLACEFLRNLHALLAEFDAFQQLHPADGTAGSSLSRARLPSMFKRATQATTGKTRRSSSAAAGTEIGLPMPQTSVSSVNPPIPSDPQLSQSTHPSNDVATSSSFSSSATTLVVSPPLAALPTASFPSSFSSFPESSSPDNPNSVLLPNEGPYTYLVTPPLPFAPDFYSVFATLCDVLIDTYQRILQYISNPSVATAAVGEMFAKADARLRKVIIGGVVKEFEDAAREASRRELLGVQKVVLGGLMGG